MATEVVQLPPSDSFLAPLNLYLDLRPDSLADMEVVGHVSVAFVAMVREIAYIIDPSLEVRVELKRGSEGSLSLDTLIADIKDPVKRKKTLIAVAIAVGLFFAQDIASWGIGATMDTVTEQEAQLSDTEAKRIDAIVRAALKDHQDVDKKEIEAIVRRVLNEGVAKREREEIFRQLARDPAISNVGASNKLSHRPDHMIPRSEFVARGGDAALEHRHEKTRTRPARLWVTLVSPVLTDTRRRWKIEINGEEFGAYFDDASFVHAMLTGETGLPLRGNVELDVSIDLHERLVGEEWQLTSPHVVTAVHGRHTPDDDSSTGQLPLSAR
jgi:hypothetical protein